MSTLGRRPLHLAYLAESGGRLKQFHEIARWVFNQNLPAARPSNDVIAKPDARILHGLNVVLKVAAPNYYSIPPTRFRSPPVGHRLRPPSGSLRWAQHQLQVLSREECKVRA